MKNLLLLILLLMCWSGSNAQTVRFSKHHDLSGMSDNVGIAVEVLPQGYATLSFEGCDPKADWDYCTRLTIMDTLGEVLQHKIFRRLRLEGIRYHPQDSTFLLWGDYKVFGEDYAVVMLKTNYRGDTIWHSHFNPPNVEFARQTLELPDKSIILSTCPRYTSGNDATIIKTDSVGKLLWVKGYDTGNYFKSYDVQGLMAWKDSTVLLCANGIGFDTVDNVYFDAGIALFQIDYDGVLRYDTAYPLTGFSNDARPLLAMTTKGRIVTASSSDALIPSILGSSLLAINMGDKSIDWHIGFPEAGGQNTIFRLYTTLDSGIIVCGQNFPNPIGVGNYHGWFFKADSEGKLLWQRFILRSMARSMNDIKPTPDGGYIAVGSFTDVDDNYRSYAWLAKFDGDGCLQPNCDEYLVTTPVRDPVLPTVVGLQVQPNPAGGQCTVTLTGSEPGGLLRIVNALGATVREVQVSGSQTAVSTAGLPAGVYVVQHMEEGAVRAVGRVVVQR